MKKKLFALASGFFLLNVCLTSEATTIVNGSFENGFTGWSTVDLSNPADPLSTVGPGYCPSGQRNGDPNWCLFFSTTPTDGNMVAQHGLTGNGPGTIRIFQDITVDQESLITFDYRAGWLNFQPQAQVRLFDVNIRSIADDTILQSTNFITASAGSIMRDTGSVSGSLSIAAYTNQTVRLSFDWYVQDSFGTPALFQLDNVNASDPAPVPEPATMLLMGTGLAGLLRARRKKK